MNQTSSPTVEPIGRGRIRLYPDQAQLLLNLITEERYRILDERKNARLVGVTNLTSYNQHLHRLIRMRQEILRTADEMGWVVRDEYLREDS